MVDTLWHNEKRLVISHLSFVIGDRKGQMMQFAKDSSKKLSPSQMTNDQ
ncbi:MAG: hypothetical protein U7127_18530 [Phormidium sp.]